MKPELFLCMLLLVQSVAYAYSWTTPETPSNAETVQEEEEGLFATIKNTFTGIGSAIGETFGKMSSSVYSFFTTVNEWIGEFILLLRIAYWILALIFIQAIFIGFWILIVKTALKLKILLDLATNTEETVKSISAWAGAHSKKIQGTSTDVAIALLKSVF